MSAPPVNIQSYIDLILSSKQTSSWLLEALASALQRDSVDALSDIQLLLEIITRVTHRTTPTLGD